MSFLGIFKFGNGPIKGSIFYKYTSRSQSTRGIMATVLGTVAMISFVVTILSSFGGRGIGTARMGAVGFLSMIFAVAGLVLGVLSLYEKEKFPWFPRVGFAVSLVSTVCWGCVLLLGMGILAL